MPYSKTFLVLTTEGDEYIDKDEIGKRLGVTMRTVERLIKKYVKKLKKYRRKYGRKFLYLWAEILICAKLHKGVERENIPSTAIKRAYMKQRAQELESENKRLKEEHDDRRVTTTESVPF